MALVAAFSLLRQVAGRRRTGTLISKCSLSSNKELRTLAAARRDEGRLFVNSKRIECGDSIQRHPWVYRGQCGARVDSVLVARGLRKPDATDQVAETR